MKYDIKAKCIENIDPWGNKPTNLEIGQIYDVVYISMGQSNTSILLKDKGSYNSVLFRFYEDGKEIDIYKDSRFNPYLKQK